jgi:hypothetical protein
MRNKAEAAWKEKARQIPPQQWRDAIDKIEDKEVRIQVACIVWWDFFASATCGQASTILDDLKDSWYAAINPDPEAIRLSLIALGYPEDRAQARSEGRGY